MRPWWRNADELAAQRDDLLNRSVIVPHRTGFAWGDAVDATTRALLARAAGAGWTTRAVTDGRAYLISADGRREFCLVMEFNPAPRVTHVLTHDGRDLSPADALDYLAGA
jgi:hypothetical protein